MNEWFPEMMDKPDGSMAGGALAYILAMFLILPFFLLVFMLDVFASETAQLWLEIGFHVLSFVLCIQLFRYHFTDSTRYAQQNPRKFLAVTGVCLALSLGVLVGYYFLFRSLSPSSAFVEFGFYFTVPMTEKNFVTYPLNMLMENPFPTFFCMAVLAPVSISCLYYGGCFAQVCYRNPWLAYPAVALLLFLPRLVNCFTFRWINEMEMVLYLTQLPLHLIACYAYQRTESIWSPILIHSIVNIFSCVVMILLSIV